MSISIPESEAPSRFAEIMTNVMAGEEVVITRGRQNVAKVVPSREARSVTATPPVTLEEHLELMRTLQEESAARKGPVDVAQLVRDCRP